MQLFQAIGICCCIKPTPYNKDLRPDALLDSSLVQPGPEPVSKGGQSTFPCSGFSRAQGLPIPISPSPFKPPRITTKFKSTLLYTKKGSTKGPVALKQHNSLHFHTSSDCSILCSAWLRRCHLQHLFALSFRAVSGISARSP